MVHITTETGQHWRRVVMDLTASTLSLAEDGSTGTALLSRASPNSATGAYCTNPRRQSVTRCRNDLGPELGVGAGLQDALAVRMQVVEAAVAVGRVTVTVRRALPTRNVSLLPSTS
ncbi:MAG: hypothetical protein IPH48_15940 [bacterium]|nr:hypothetical protein [bacterium]